jgi:hypothetical protein
MSTAISDAYDWLDGAEDLYPCDRSAALSLRRAAVRGDAARARRILSTHLKGKLDVPRLADVLHLLVQLGLVQDLLSAGLSAAAMSPVMQGCWVKAAVSAGLPGDTSALLEAGFACPPETRHDIRSKAIHSGAWRDVERRL